MAEGIVYLDVDDEITSAASRIRTSTSTKVALVVPYGSRIATSRMNFRLLSREALVSNRRLSIVSGDSAARSLAASAGLPVFATVGEYESSLAQPAEGVAGSAAGGGPAVPTGRAEAAALPAGLAASETVVASAGPSPAAGADVATPAAGASPARKSQRPKRPGPEETTIATPPPAGTVPAAGAAADAVGWTPTRPDARPAAGRADETAADVSLPSLLGGRIRAPLIAAVGLVALAVVVLAVGAWVFLPSASIALTPRRDPIGPIELTVAADPNATEVDAVNGVVPATRLEVPVEAGRTFTTSGVKVKETPAGGSVTFTNYDPTSSNTIAAGSIVSTEGGIRFRTLSTLVVPRANFTPPSTTVPTEASVAIQAVKPGTEGNVPANAIRVVPQGESSLFLAVRNADPTSGGTHTETPEVTRAEVDKAVAGLQGDLEAAFRQIIAAGAGAPPDTTLFPDTADLGRATPDVDPATLVGQAVATFDLKLTATGTVIAVDPRPVRTIARSRLDAEVPKDHRLIEDSITIDVGDGTVGEDRQVTFQATVRATEVAIVDPGVLRGLVKNKTAAEAEAALAPYGTATVSLWPNWVSTVTGVDARLSVSILDGTSGGSGASPSPGSGSGGPDPSASGARRSVGPSPAAPSGSPAP